MATRSSRRSLPSGARAVLLFLAIVFGLLLVAPRTAAIADEPSSYPEKGKVVAVRVEEHTETVPITPPDSKGRTHGGQTYVYRKRIYRVETDDGTYELQDGKNPTMAVGDSIEFRVEKGTAHLADGKKKKYKIISTTLRPKP